MGRRINQEKLLAKIAAITNLELADVKEAAEKSNLYSHEEQVLESQSVINFYRSRIAPQKPIKKQGEKELDFQSRKLAYERAYNEWHIRECEGCHLPFAYAFSYEGVKFCSLDCLDSELRKIGLHVTRGRDLRKRWGVFSHPAIIPSSAFEALQNLPETDAAVFSVDVH